MISVRGIWTDIDRWGLELYRYMEVGLISIRGVWTDIDRWSLDWLIS
jgi:hypothetical protein